MKREGKVGFRVRKQERDMDGGNWICCTGKKNDVRNSKLRVGTLSKTGVKRKNISFEGSRRRKTILAGPI